ncbi:hypothetical protein RclHR1_03110025 [Rhizophagus clarus]|uniref:Uncharacterized protein n=1 Tax=Rhizophagus clarus TaxID=94130 RepID=A0A2Z6R6Z9_9GLOM|nr:hypothetical protein RclHR1_03110025 [Rhizophagus clarus]
MANGNHGNNENNGDAYEGNGNNIPYHLRRTYESLTRRQREIYDALPTRESKILNLETLIEERKKSEIGSEVMSCVIYTFITCLIISIYGFYFKSEEESTKYFIVLLNSIYYLAKILILGITMERLGILYNNKVRFYTAIPNIVCTSLAIFLGIFVLSPTISISLVNVGIDIAKVIVKFYG